MDLLTEVKDYFADSDHWRRLCASLQEPDPHGAHIHAYVETSLHPESLENIITGYFKRMGWPSSRKIDHMAPKKGMGSLHGVEPLGKPHFDYQWFFNKNVGLRPCEAGESGCNLLIWNRSYINRFYDQFPFRNVGPTEEIVLEEYFRSAHFLNGLKIPVLPTTNHMHINVHSSVHPEHIRRFAEAAFRREGIQIHYTCPNVYMVGGKYRGKLVFMGKRPEVVFDIGWKFTPGTIIEPAWEPWIFDANPGYDIWTSEMLAEVMAEDYVKLTPAQTEEVLQGCRFPV